MCWCLTHISIQESTYQECIRGWPREKTGASLFSAFLSYLKQDERIVQTKKNNSCMEVIIIYPWSLALFIHVTCWLIKKRLSCWFLNGTTQTNISNYGEKNKKCSCSAGVMMLCCNTFFCVCKEYRSLTLHYYFDLKFIYLINLQILMYKDNLIQWNGIFFKEFCWKKMHHTSWLRGGNTLRICDLPRKTNMSRHLILSIPILDIVTCPWHFQLRSGVTSGSNGCFIWE